MAYSQISVKLLQMLRLKDLIAQAHALLNRNPAFGAFCIVYRDAAAFLPPVLKGKQPVINGGRHVVSVKIIDAEHTALFTQLIPGQIKIHLHHVCRNPFCSLKPPLYQTALRAPASALIRRHY